MCENIKEGTVEWEIGTDYINWKNGEKVFISAPTGSGKTYFILNVLLPYAYRQGRTIVYLVNRRILAKQIQHDIEVIDESFIGNGYFGLKEMITVMTYQELEKCAKGTEGIPYALNWCTYVVCDESHYFLSDSLFNTSTIVSYNVIASLFASKITIFISATMGAFEGIIKNQEASRNGFVLSDAAAMYNADNSYQEFEKIFEATLHRYELSLKYKYLDVKFFEKVDEIVDIIENASEKQKWLIFYNDIEKGKELEKELIENGLDAVFIDAEYEKSEITKSVVESIATENIFENQILIATSVLDNGVSIKDLQLRNIIVLAESEHEFIQMLGRKREDGEKVTLYLCPRSLEEFSRRLTIMQRSQCVYRACMKYIIENRQIELVDELLRNRDFYFNAKKFIYQARNTTLYNSTNVFDRFPNICINTFSVVAFTKQIIFYKEMIEKFKEEGDKAFLLTQLGWLGMKEEDIEQVVILGTEDRKMNLRQKLTRILEQVCEKEFNLKESADFKVDKVRPVLQPLLKMLVDADKFKNCKEFLRKRERAFSADKFNEYMEIVELKFYMTGGEGKAPYVIHRKSE